MSQNHSLYFIPFQLIDLFSMLSSSLTSCSQCNEIGILTCDGCNKLYCQQHLHDHQRYLGEELDWLTVEHDDLMEDLVQQIATPKYHPSMGIHQ